MKYASARRSGTYLGTKQARKRGLSNALRVRLLRQLCPPEPWRADDDGVHRGPRAGAGKRTGSLYAEPGVLRQEAPQAILRIRPGPQSRTLRQRLLDPRLCA